MADAKNNVKNLFIFNEPKQEENFVLKENNLDNKASAKQEVRISRRLTVNLEYMKERYFIPTNGDVIIKEFKISIMDQVIKAFIIFFDGMVNTKLIDDNILQPLMLLSNLKTNSINNSMAKYIREQLIPHNSIIEAREYNPIIEQINFGGCGIFIDGIDSAFAADVKGFEHRGVEKPNNELIIKGPQEGFNEVLRVNTALLRKRLKDEDLIVENISIGERSKTPCSIIYIKDIANDSLVKEFRRRLSSIKTDYLNDSGQIEQFIEDSTFVPTPQMLATERPDRVALLLAEGRIAVAVNGSPYVLVAPVTFYDLIHSVEDNYTRFPFGNLMRATRLVGMLVALLLPSIYIAITNFHQEMIPTSLLLAIESSREKVPFPSIVEILAMEISFELIREAGVRIPGPLGPTIGIIGGIILGQAAVSANIVSPILIIIVAVTGIGSFSIPDFTLSFAFRLLRFLFIILGLLSGFLGITTGLFVMGIVLSNAKSFGVPYLSPYGPKTNGGFTSELYKAPIWKEEKRPDYLNPKDIQREPKISRGWVKTKKNENK